MWKKRIREILAARWPPVPPSAPQSNQGEMSHFLASVGACNVILHIYVMVNWQLSKHAGQYHNIAGSSVNPLRLRVFKLSADKLLAFNWSRAQLQADCFAMVKSYFFEVNYKFINNSFAFSLG